MARYRTIGLPAFTCLLLIGCATTTQESLLRQEQREILAKSEPIFQRPMILDMPWGRNKPYTVQQDVELSIVSALQALVQDSKGTRVCFEKREARKAVLSAGLTPCLSDGEDNRSSETAIMVGIIDIDAQYADRFAIQLLPIGFDPRVKDSFGASSIKGGIGFACLDWSVIYWKLEGRWKKTQEVKRPFDECHKMTVETIIVT